METNKELSIIINWIETGIFTTQVYNVLSIKIKQFIYNYSNNWLTKDAIEDVIQDLLIKLHNSRESIDKGGVLSYMKQMVNNHLTDILRKKKINKSSIDDEKDIDRLKDLSDSSFEEDIDKMGKKTIQSFDEKIKQRIFRWAKWKDIESDNNYPKITKSEILSTFTGVSQSDYDFYKISSRKILRYNNWKYSDNKTTGYMSLSIDEMKKSLSEKREDDKIDPMVGTVLINSDNEIIAKSFRGEVEEKGHSEYNLLENKIDDRYIKRRYTIPKGKEGEGANVTELNIDNATLFVTLEPCSVRGHSKCSCSDRIIYSKGIKTVYIGLKDPDGSIDGGGIAKLEKAGIVVKSYPINLVVDIIKAISLEDGTKRNLDFILSKNKSYLEKQPEIFAEILKE